MIRKYIDVSEQMQGKVKKSPRIVINDIKKRQTTALILTLPKVGEPYVVYTDASRDVCGGVLI